MYTFPGAHSLAASWETSAPTVAQRRWVTACLMARTNVFGLSVATSLRHDTNPALQASGAEKATYSSVEAGFYGDLFAAGSPMFACASQIFAPGGNPALESIRACARSNNGFTTQCGFSYTWLCGQTLSGHAAACLDTVAPYGSCRGSAVTYAESVTLYAAP
jgi:hypothetical protein